MRDALARLSRERLERQREEAAARLREAFAGLSQESRERLELEREEPATPVAVTAPIEALAAAA